MEYAERTLTLNCEVCPMMEIDKEVHEALMKAHENSSKLISKGKSATNALLSVDTADKRPQLGHWAPGNYEHECYLCGNKFLGDKRAGTCAPCEYKDT